MFSTDLPIKEWHCSRFIPGEEDDDGEHVENVLIVLNSDLPKNFKYYWKRAKKRICADGGANRIFDALDREERRKWIPHIIKGDFDSIRKDVMDNFQEMVHFESLTHR